MKDIRIADIIPNGIRGNADIPRLSEMPTVAGMEV